MRICSIFLLRKHIMSLQENLGKTIVRLRREKSFPKEAFANEASIDRLNEMVEKVVFENESYIR